MTKVEFQVLGKDWVMRIMKKKKYRKVNGTDSCAITYINKRRIDIGPAGMDKETITHELVHAYLAELCVKSSDLDDDNLEEIFAELMSKRGREMLDLADVLFDKMMAVTSPKVNGVPI